MTAERPYRDMGRALRSVALAVAAVGCLAAPAEVAPSHAPEPNAPRAPATVTPPPPWHRAGVGPAKLVLVEDDGTGNALRGRPVDPATLGDLEGYASLSFGHHYTVARSPNGGTVASVVYPGGTNNAGARLHVIDLATWTDRVVDVENPGYAVGLAFADERQVYWLSEHGYLRRVDIATAMAREAARLPRDFEFHEMRLFDEGRKLAVFGVPLNLSFRVGQGIGHVFVVDLTSGAVDAVRLDGVRAGQFQTATNGPWRMVRPGLAWDAPRERLHVVHADAERVTQVDLATASVIATREIGARASWLDSLASFFVLRAEAKVVAGTERWARVSPDGALLYLSTHRTEIDEAAAWGATRFGEGLRAIDLSSLREVARVDGEVTAFAISPRGDRLAVAWFDGARRGWDERPVHGLHLGVFDAWLGEVAAVPVSDWSWSLAFSADGVAAYVGSEGATAGQRVLRAIDASSGRILAERSVPRWSAELLGPWLAAP